MKYNFHFQFKHSLNVMVQKIYCNIMYEIHKQLKTPVVVYELSFLSKHFCMFVIWDVRLHVLLNPDRIGELNIQTPTYLDSPRSEGWGLQESATIPLSVPGGLQESVTIPLSVPFSYRPAIFMFQTSVICWSCKSVIPPSLPNTCWSHDCSSEN